MVDISLPFEPDSRVDTVCYDVHRRLRTFETETISARLQLAAVCIRAGTNVPSKRLQMTGAEAALHIYGPVGRVDLILHLKKILYGRFVNGVFAFPQ
ncbi:hypothetical protein GN244_ATG17233 [Phytophthora infestans]|uniref:Uncharacterized protein n=1 Tax=Phytophthora infestans TaxID=4787 RepID=A0A833S216_PHYIN|nr:hypothetical protein GN244_ATG17233 [Phytophthora infestans]